MEPLDSLMICLGFVAIAAFSSLVTSIYWSGRMRGLYTRGWLAGRNFTEEERKRERL